MAGRRVTFAKVALTRAVEAVKDAGVVVGEVKIETDGSIRIIATDGFPASISPLENWKARRGQR
jgi:hypothetical protein